jgi:hypothetical protein
VKVAAPTRRTAPPPLSVEDEREQRWRQGDQQAQSKFMFEAHHHGLLHPWRELELSGSHGRSEVRHLGVR